METKKAEIKKIKLVSEICSSWGFTGKRRAIDDVAKGLKEKGYKTEVQYVAVPGGTGAYKLNVVLQNGKEKVVFSNNKADEKKGATIGHGPKENKKEIIDKVIALA